MSGNSGIARQINDLKKCLYRILDGPLETSRIKTEIDQKINIDKKTAEALAKNAKGDIYIVNAAQVNSQIVSDSGKALRLVDGIQNSLDDESANFERIIHDLFRKGWTAESIEDFVRRKIYDYAVSCTTSKAAAARMLGLKRGCFNERRKQQRRLEDVIDMET